MPSPIVCFAECLPYRSRYEYNYRRGVFGYRDEVACQEGLVFYFLWGTEIARKSVELDALTIRHGGWHTPLTRNRLNAILGAHGLPYRVGLVRGRLVLFLTGEGDEFLDFTKVTFDLRTRSVVSYDGRLGAVIPRLGRKSLSVFQDFGGDWYVVSKEREGRKVREVWVSKFFRSVRKFVLLRVSGRYNGLSRRGYVCYECTDGPLIEEVRVTRNVRWPDDEGPSDWDEWW